MRLIEPSSGPPADITRYLLPHETQTFTARQHPAVLAGPVITAVAGLTAAAIVALVISPGHEALSVAVWIAAGLLLLRAAVRVASWLVDYFVVTSQRIMMLTGVFTRRMASIPLLRVNDISYDRSAIGRRLGYGEFHVRYGARNQVLQRIQYIPDPEEFYQHIREIFSGTAGESAPDGEPAGDERADGERAEDERET
jgi:membrane protein YdbS with pleckstrin-like domain